MARLPLDLTTDRNAHIGTGALFPFRFTTNGAVQGDDPRDADIVRIRKRINGSIDHILSTKRGSRYRRPLFGSRLHLLTFEQNDQILNDLIEIYVNEALAWEKRITLTGIYISRDPRNEHQVNIDIHYYINKQQVEGNYVYPFVTSAG